MENSDFRRPVALVKFENYFYIITDDFLPGIWQFDIKRRILTFISLEQYNIYSPSAISIINKDLMVLFDSISSQFYILNNELSVVDRINAKRNIYVSSICYSLKRNCLFCSDQKNDSVIKIDMSNYKISTIRLKNKLLDKPHWVTIDRDDEILIVDTGNNRIIQFGLENKSSQTHLKFGRGGIGKVRKPTSLVVGKLNYYVFDSNNYIIQTFNKSDFQFIEQIGRKGYKLNQFDLPISGFFENQKLYIADKNNDRVLMYDENSKIVKEICKPSFKPGRLRRPVRITTDTKDNIYIADRDNDCIQVFDKNNVYKMVIVRSNESEDIIRPSSVGIIEDGNNTNVVYISRGIRNSELSIINLNSLKKTRIDVSLIDPQDMDVNDDGQVLIANTLSRSVLHLGKGGCLIREINSAEISQNSRILIKGVCFGKNSDILYADYDKCKIYIHNLENGDLLNVINLHRYKNQISEIKSVTATPNKIILCTRGSHPIWVIDYKGKILKKIGEKGKGEYSFRNPSNVYIMNCGDILIVDKENDRIVRYSDEFNYITDFGSS